MAEPSGERNTPPAPGGRIAVEVVYALPERWWREVLSLPRGARVADALAATTLPRQVPGLVVDTSHLAVHGRAVRPDAALADGDRLELLRPLQCDPKEVRRRRAAQAGHAGRGRRTR